MTASTTGTWGAPAAAVFNPCGPLPRGTSLLEASAGTGKTWTIAALVTRYVAEGLCRIDELLVVSFGRAASAELRDRVRARLVGAAAELADPQAAKVSGDPVVQHLAGGDPVAARANLRRALASFDASTITTTHGFCQQMLARLGLAGDRSAGETLVGSSVDVVDQVVGDLLLLAHQSGGPGVPFSAVTARKLGRAAVAERACDRVPTDAPPGSEADVRSRFAARTVALVDERKRRLGLLDFDDLLLRLRSALTDPVTGAAAVSRLRSRYRVVLVDEFQDTDPVQWSILQRAFHLDPTAGLDAIGQLGPAAEPGDTHRALVLIGDPKQAIYAFRGGDVHAYLAAKRAAHSHATLATNQRTDAVVVRALGRLWDGLALGDPEILVHPVDARHTGRRLLVGGEPAPGVRARWVPTSHFQEPSPKVDALREVVVADLAALVVEQLGGRTTWSTGSTGEAADDVPADGRRLQPGDIAVLVPSHKRAHQVQKALTEAGVPVVLAGGVDVFQTEAAQAWAGLLRVLEQPHRTGLVRALATGPFVGWTAEHLLAEQSVEQERLAIAVRDWVAVMQEHGVAALMETLEHTTELVPRLLGTVDGERVLTDLRHLAELLHVAAVERSLGIASLREWLAARCAETLDDGTTERRRRLDSDAAAVQVLTVHVSKGLEFPVVHVPFGWDTWSPGRADTTTYVLHDGDHRLLDVGGMGAPGADDRWRVHEGEQAGEELRDLYVALTRAAGQVVLWYAANQKNTPASGLHRILLGERGMDGSVPQTVPVQPDDRVAEALQVWTARSDGAVEITRVGSSGRACWSGPSSPQQPLSAARFDRRWDRLWRRTSYTGLTSAAHEAGLADVGAVSEPEVDLHRDEPDTAAAVDRIAETTDSSWPAPDRPAVRSPLADQPSGAAFGTLVHSVLETVDTGADDLAVELRERCRQAVVRGGAAGLDPAALARALLPVLRTPLGPVADDRTLAGVAVSDRLPELDFELPLAGGDDPVRSSATLGRVADLVAQHLPVGDRLAGYPDALRDPLLSGQVLRGYLTGSIDAVLRLEGPRYAVVDYKTNWLGAFGPSAPPLSTADYGQQALTEAMIHAHYPLQALLYSVALHRVLRWRQPGYEPQRHLGGVLYLFVRGMAGAETPREAGHPAGVFGWTPPAGLVVALSDLLATGVGR